MSLKPALKTIIICFIFTMLVFPQNVISQTTQIKTTLKNSSHPYGGNLRIGMFMKPTIIHPVYTTDSNAVMMYNLIFSQLIQLDPDTKPVPDLAERWDISSDGLIYTFYLRKGVKFHDGVECTAEDVKFTYDSIVTPQNESPFLNEHQNVKTIKIVDKHTLQIVLEKPEDDYINLLVRGILPKHLFDGKGLKNEEFLVCPIGSGPFEFKGKRGNEEIVLGANEEYYAGCPYLDKVTFVPLYDRKAIGYPLFRDEIDMATFLSFKQFRYAKEDSSLNAYAIESDLYYGIAYDLEDEFLSNKNVRRAIALSIDQDYIIDQCLQGQGSPSYGPFYPSLIGESYDVMPVKYDPEKAVKILEQEGFILEKGEAHRKKDGKKLELCITSTPGLPNNEIILKGILVQLAMVGIKVNYSKYDKYKDLEKELKEKKKGINTLLKLFNGGTDYSISYWDSYSDLQYNFKLSRYKNDRIDQIIKESKSTFDDDARKELYQEMHAIIYDEQPICFLPTYYVFHAMSKRFKNTNDYFSLGMPPYTIKDFYVDDSLQPRKLR